MTPSRENKFALSILLNNSDRHIHVAVEHQRMSLSIGLCLAKTESAFEMNKIQRGRVTC